MPDARLKTCKDLERDCTLTSIQLDLPALAVFQSCLSVSDLMAATYTSKGVGY